ncbi:MFS transporter [Halostagnicola bangensis]
MSTTNLVQGRDWDGLNPVVVLVVLLALTWFVLSIYRVTFSVAIPDATELTSVTYTGATFLFGALFVGYAVSQFPAGSLADRLGVRTILLGGATIACIALASLSVAGSYVHVFTALFLVGVGLGSFRSVSQVAISTYTSEANEGKALGLLTAAEPFSYVIGPALVALLIERTSLFTMPLFLALAPIPFVALLYSSTSGHHRPEETTVETPSVRTGLATVREHLHTRTTLLVIGFGAAFSTTTNALIAILPWYIIDTTGLSLTTGNLYAGVVFGVGAISAVVGGVLRDRIGACPILLAGFGGAMLAIPLLGIGSSLGWILVVLGAFSLSLNGILPARDRVINAHARACSSSETGAIIGGLRSCYYLGGGIGAVVVGLTFAQLGRLVGFGFLSTVLLLGGVCSGLLWYTTGDRH